jgi:hypothetical protein
MAIIKLSYGNCKDIQFATILKIQPESISAFPALSVTMKPSRTSRVESNYDHGQNNMVR